MTTFKKVESRKDNNYLKEEDLINQVPCTRVCYVVNQWAKVSKLDTGFFTLLVKTCDGISVVARIFDVSDFINQGLDIANLVGKFIEIKCTPSIWQGSYNIIIDKIFIIDQASVKHTHQFLGMVENVEDLFLKCDKVFSNLEIGQLPTVYKFSSHISIYNGMIGGFVKFIWSWIFQCMVYTGDLGSEFMSVLYKCIILYSNYLEKLEGEDVEKISDKIEILKRINTEESKINKITSDCMQAILGLGKPEHLIANVIYDQFEATKKHAVMFTDWKRIVEGGASTSRDYVLRKY